VCASSRSLLCRSTTWGRSCFRGLPLMVARGGKGNQTILSSEDEHASGELDEHASRPTSLRV